MKQRKKSWISWITLFVTSSTLLCCTLPILLVSLGFGAVVASLFYNIPGLMFLAEHKFWTLSISAIMLIILGWTIWKPNQNCPTDPILASYCQKTNKWNRWLFSLSVVLWLLGFFFSTLILPLRELLNL